MAIEVEQIVLEEEPGEETTTDLACEVCGTPLVYAGRGRKPKRCADHKSSGGSTGSAGSSRGGVGRGSAGVEQAVATLGNIYDAVSLGFMLASSTDLPPDGQPVSIWQSNVAELQTRNRQILMGDPELVKSINRLGVKGGKYAFIAAQAMALTPPTMVAIQVLRTRAETVATEREAQARREQMRQTAQEQRGPSAGNAEFFGA